MVPGKPERREQRCVNLSPAMWMHGDSRGSGVLDEYVATSLRLFEALGMTVNTSQTDRLREVLEGQSQAAFEALPRSTVVIT